MSKEACGSPWKASRKADMCGCGAEIGIPGQSPSPPMPSAVAWKPILVGLAVVSVVVAVVLLRGASYGMSTGDESRVAVIKGKGHGGSHGGGPSRPMTPVPGPAGVLGVMSAFTISRRLRRRIHGEK